MLYAVVSINIWFQLYMKTQAIYFGPFMILISLSRSPTDLRRPVFYKQKNKLYQLISSSDDDALLFAPWCPLRTCYLSQLGSRAFCTYLLLQGALCSTSTGSRTRVQNRSTTYAVKSSRPSCRLSQHASMRLGFDEVVLEMLTKKERKKWRADCVWSVVSLYGDVKHGFIPVIHHLLSSSLSFLAQFLSTSYISFLLLTQNHQICHCNCNQCHSSTSICVSFSH